MACVGIWSIITIFRNQIVLQYRLKLIDKIYSFSDWEWRLEVFHSVSYNKMVGQFWRRCDSFYPDKSFINK